MEPEAFPNQKSVGYALYRYCASRKRNIRYGQTKKYCKLRQWCVEWTEAHSTHECPRKNNKCKVCEGNQYQRLYDASFAKSPR